MNTVLSSWDMTIPSLVISLFVPAVAIRALHRSVLDNLVSDQFVRTQMHYIQNKLPLKIHTEDMKLLPKIYQQQKERRSKTSHF